MMAFSGNQQMVPMIPVKVIRDFGAGSLRLARSCCGETTSAFNGTGIMEGSGASLKHNILTYGHPRSQGTDSTAAGTARGIPVPQRGGRHDLRREGARPAGPG